MANFTINGNWKKNSLHLLKDHSKRNEIVNTLFAVLSQIERNNWQGACHATCGVLHILLSEQEINSKLIVGEAKKGNAYFNHSWIQIEDFVYDLAISNPLVPEYGNPPTVMGYDVDTMKSSEVEYGVNSGLGDDMPTTIIKSMSLSEYFSNFPGHPTLGLWVAVLDGAQQLGLNIDLNSCQDKHSQTFWDEQ